MNGPSPLVLQVLEDAADNAFRDACFAFEARDEIGHSAAAARHEMIRRLWAAFRRVGVSA